MNGVLQFIAGYPSRAFDRSGQHSYEKSVKQNEVRRRNRGIVAMYRVYVWTIVLNVAWRDSRARRGP